MNGHIADHWVDGSTPFSSRAEGRTKRKSLLSWERGFLLLDFPRQGGNPQPCFLDPASTE